MYILSQKQNHHLLRNVVSLFIYFFFKSTYYFEMVFCWSFFSVFIILTDTNGKMTIQNIFLVACILQIIKRGN